MSDAFDTLRNMNKNLHKETEKFTEADNSGCYRICFRKAKKKTKMDKCKESVNVASKKAKIFGSALFKSVSTSGKMLSACTVGVFKGIKDIFELTLDYGVSKSIYNFTQFAMTVNLIMCLFYVTLTPFQHIMWNVIQVCIAIHIIGIILLKRYDVGHVCPHCGANHAWGLERLSDIDEGTQQTSDQYGYYLIHVYRRGRSRYYCPVCGYEEVNNGHLDEETTVLGLTPLGEARELRRTMERKMEHDREMEEQRARRAEEDYRRSEAQHARQMQEMADQISELKRLKGQY